MTCEYRFSDMIQYFLDYNGDYEQSSLDPLRSIVVRIDNYNFTMEMELFYNSILLMVLSKSNTRVCTAKYDPSSGYLSWVAKLPERIEVISYECLEDFLDEGIYFQKSLITKISHTHSEVVELYDLLGKCSSKLLSIGGVHEQLYE